MLVDMPIPVIAAINGYAGAGLELAACTYYRRSYATRITGVNLGLFPMRNPGTIIGLGRAMELILTGRMVNR